MRLIDADALMPNAEYKGRYDVVTAYDIANAPTIEPEPKKGKWIAHPNKEFKEWDVCTACGVGCKRREYEDGGVTEYNYPYCPNCGARMEDNYG